MDESDGAELTVSLSSLPLAFYHIPLQQKKTYYKDRQKKEEENKRMRRIILDRSQKEREAVREGL